MLITICEIFFFFFIKLYVCLNLKLIPHASKVDVDKMHEIDTGQHRAHHKALCGPRRSSQDDNDEPPCGKPPKNCCKKEENSMVLLLVQYLSNEQHKAVTSEAVTRDGEELWQREVCLAKVSQEEGQHRQTQPISHS